MENISKENMKVSLRLDVEEQLTNQIDVKLKLEEIILYEKQRKNIECKIKVLKELQFQFKIIAEFVLEDTIQKWQETITIKGDSLAKSQFVANQELRKIQCLNTELLNGTSTTGTFFLVNNYHEPCNFKLIQIVEIHEEIPLFERMKELVLKVQNASGLINSKGNVEVKYQLETRQSQNDKHFTSRYSHLEVKDDQNAYKLKNSKYFKKNLEAILRVQFGEDNFLTFKIKAHIVNPAIRVSHALVENKQVFSLCNDTGLEVPFRLENKYFFTSKIQKGKLKCGMNHLEIEWQKSYNSVIKSKQNSSDKIRSVICLEIPRNQLVIYDNTPLQRPKTAISRNSIMKAEQLKEKISQRGQSRVGDYGIRTVHTVSPNDYLKIPNKYIKDQEFEIEDYQYFQISQNDKGIQLVNAHKSKCICIFVIGKGYLYLQRQNIYFLPLDGRSFRFQFGGKHFQIRARDQENQQLYRISARQLYFQFDTKSKYQVTKEVEVQNQSNYPITMCCLSLNDDCFHSLQPNNKIQIMPKCVGRYKLGFFPKSNAKQKSNKTTRKITFLINGKKEQIECKGKFLDCEVELSEKSLIFNGVPFTPEEVQAKFSIINKGMTKVQCKIVHLQKIKIDHCESFITEGNKQMYKLSFIPTQLPKQYNEDIEIHIKGSHIIILPIRIRSLEPNVLCSQDMLDFGSGLVKQKLKAKITIQNKNKYQCKILFNFKNADIEGPESIVLQAGQETDVQLSVVVREVGEIYKDMPKNWLAIDKYGPIKGPQSYTYKGKSTLLQLIPDDPFENFCVSNMNEVWQFQLKSLLKKKATISLSIVPKQLQKPIILSLETSEYVTYPQEIKQFKFYSVRCEDEEYEDNKILHYDVKIFLDKILYQSIPFSVQLAPPTLSIQPEDVYFPITSHGNWAKSSFKICNKGYKEVMLYLKKPSNIIFQLQATSLQGTTLSKLVNSTTVQVLFKSKKPISFTVVLEIQDNFGKKYLVRLNGTASDSPLLNCQKLTPGSSKGQSNKSFNLASSRDIRFSGTHSNLDEQNQISDNVRFINRWIWAALPQSSRENQPFNIWLKNKKNFITLLAYLQCPITSAKEPLTFETVFEQLKRNSYQICTIDENKIASGNQYQWLTLFWLILSKIIPCEDILKWVNKLCKTNIDNFEAAFNNQRKITMEIFSKALEPIFTGKLPEWQKVIQCLEPSLPYITRIDNKRQFILLLAVVFHKFARPQRNKCVLTTFEQQIKFIPLENQKRYYWLLCSSNIEVIESPNCNNVKHVREKKMITLWAEKQASIKIKVKENISIILWSNSFHEPAIYYDLEVSKPPPVIHYICIQCEDKRSQQWKLQFSCMHQAEYFFEFSGGSQFKCKMPDVGGGVIKAEQVLEFRVIYSPSNLREHASTLRIYSKFEEHVYNLKGKPIKSNEISLERTVKILQGKKMVQTFSMIEQVRAEKKIDAEDPLTYKVTQCLKKSPQVKDLRASSNGKQIFIEVTLECANFFQNKQIILEISDSQAISTKYAKLIVSVVPHPVAISAQLKGIFERTTIQNIPITNILQIEQNCYISLHQLTQQQYKSYSKFDLYKEAVPPLMQDKGEVQFKLSHKGKMLLRPKDKGHIQLNYCPVSLTTNYCQIRIKMQKSQHLIVYNFAGLPELPNFDNPITNITCEVEKECVQYLKILNRIRDRIDFTVQTNIDFLAGPQEITINSRQTYEYPMKLYAIHPGQYKGEIIFKSQKFSLAYPLKIQVEHKKKIKTIKLESKVRITTEIQIQLHNKTEYLIQYEIFCNSQYVKHEKYFTIHSKQRKNLSLSYTPLFIGSKFAELKLFNKKMPEIIYNLDMLSEEHKEQISLAAEVGKKKMFILTLSNPTDSSAIIQCPQLPREIASQHHFPITIPPFTDFRAEFNFIQTKLAQYHEVSFSLYSETINNYNYKISANVADEKWLEATKVQFDSFELQEQQFERACHIWCLNEFDETLDFYLASPIIQINKETQLIIEDSQNFTLKSYDKRQIKCVIKYQQRGYQSHQAQYTNLIKFRCKQFFWNFPIHFIEVIHMPITLQIFGASNSLIKTRVTTTNLVAIKDWTVQDIQNHQDFMHLLNITPTDVFVQTLLTTNLQIHTSITFYDITMTKAERYKLHIKIGNQKYQKISLLANVGEVSRAEIKLKKGKGPFHVQLKNNKAGQFSVVPLEGCLEEDSNNVVTFQYHPKQYNGNKSAQVIIVSQMGCFNFHLIGKFPPLK